MIRAIVELGGTYPDVVQALQQAKADGALPSRFEVDALPQPGRRYDRDVQQAIQAEGDKPADAEDGGQRRSKWRRRCRNCSAGQSEKKLSDVGYRLSARPDPSIADIRHPTALRKPLILLMLKGSRTLRL